MLVLTDQLILHLRKVRIVVNGTDIYELERNKPSVIDIQGPLCSITITDGFHHSKIFPLSFEKTSLHKLKVSTILDNGRLVFILLLTFILFILAFLNEIWFVKLVSFVPVILFLFFYYIKRRSFFLLEAV